MNRVGWIGTLEEAADLTEPKLWPLQLLIEDCSESGLIERGGAIALRPGVCMYL